VAAPSRSVVVRHPATATHSAGTRNQRENPPGRPKAMMPAVARGVPSQESATWDQRLGGSHRIARLNRVDDIAPRRRRELEFTTPNPDTRPPSAMGKTAGSFSRDASPRTRAICRFGKSRSLCPLLGLEVDARRATVRLGERGVGRIGGGDTAHAGQDSDHAHRRAWRRRDSEGQSRPLKRFFFNDRNVAWRDRPYVS